MAIYATLNKLNKEVPLNDKNMTNQSNNQSKNDQLPQKGGGEGWNDFPLKNSRKLLGNMTAEERIKWAHKEFKSKFVLTTSFGIQSAVLLNMVHLLALKEDPQIIWIDTGYLPTETYLYAEQLMQKLNLKINIVQSQISPARMEALHGRLWETNSVKDLEKYHLIRKIKPLETAFHEFDVSCWASGVRGGQTNYRNSMTCLDLVRNRLSLRPLLNWTKKDIFYYMKENDLPQHPLFEKGYSTVGDWHSSRPDTLNQEGRNTRFGGLKEECGIHLPSADEK
tara:strand:+ start:5678 stop:6517 length:840 start_codon:yes stop_codon:yes gene_type:complete